MSHRSPIAFLPRLYQFKSGRLDALARALHRSGDLEVFQVGSRRVLFVNDPELVCQVLVRGAANYRKERVIQYLGPVLGQGLVTADEPLHGIQRKQLQPAFRKRKVLDAAPLMAECALRRQASWKPGQTYPMFHEMKQLSLDVMAKLLLGEDSPHAAAAVAKSIDVLVRQTGQYMLRPWGWMMGRAAPGRTRRFAQALAQMDDALYGAIDARAEGGQSGGGLLHDLVEEQRKTGHDLDRRQLRDEFATLLLAGYETTGTALTWLWYALARNPSSAERLHAELDSVPEGPAPGQDGLSELHHARRIFRETLRLFPPAYAFGREALASHELGRMPIHRGDTIMLTPYAMHRDPRFWEEPERFWPERWDSGSGPGHHRFQYFPFGGGPRACIGENLATALALVALAVIGKHWRLELPPAHQLRYDAAVGLHPACGMPMRVEPR